MRYCSEEVKTIINRYIKKWSILFIIMQIQIRIKMRYNSHISKNDNIKNIGYDLYWQECGEKELSSTLGRRIVYSNPYEYLAFPEK